jgi:hypothetical protein
MSKAQIYADEPHTLKCRFNKETKLSSELVDVMELHVSSATAAMLTTHHHHH